MLTQEDFWMIQDLRKQGIYLNDIADRLGVHPKTVSRAIRRGGPPDRSRKRPKYTKLEPYLDKVDELLAAGVWNGEVIFKEIQALGYPGGPRVLRQYIHPKRVLRPSKATVRFETKPGEQLQHDWGELFTEIGGVSRKIYFAVNTLGYSRRFHVVAGLSCDAEHTYESLVRSFTGLVGLPAACWSTTRSAPCSSIDPTRSPSTPGSSSWPCTTASGPKLAGPIGLGPRVKSSG